MEIRAILIDKIEPYLDNPREHRDIDAIKESIKRYGFNVPLILDEEMTIISGHGRYLACKQLEFDTVPCVIVDMDEKKAREFRLADNKIREKSKWKPKALEDELRSIAIGLDEEIDESLNKLFGDLDKFNKQYVGEKYEGVRGTDINEARERLESIKQQNDLNEVECPNCGGKFHVDLN